MDGSNPTTAPVTSSTNTNTTRRLPIGAEPVEGGVHFRVWAPRRSRIEVVPDAGESIVLKGEPGGYFSGLATGGPANMRYHFRLDQEKQLYPDPASRFQPEGPHGPSQVIDPRQFNWSDAKWPGIKPDGQVLYELHVGTFTLEGTYASAERELPELARIGITCLEIMPLADFPGRFGWGYDGVDLFAPTRLYGTPDELRHFIDRAHSLGLGVILDVVYNHFGPDGNYLSAFSEHYSSSRHHTEWGIALNFDDKFSGPVREFFISNARYWVSEFHFDGFRFDATQSIFDDSREHILGAIVIAAREAAGTRNLYFVAENEYQDSIIVRPRERKGYGLTALWNDDFHHSARVALSGRNEAYYSDYLGTPQELISAIKYGYLYQGQRSRWQGKPRGSPALDLPHNAFVNYLENHDQVANSVNGARPRELTSSGRYRALTALLLLAPQTPLLFQGQEFAASSPFLYFADHPGELGAAVRAGRGKFLSQFPSAAVPESQARLADPSDERTFLRCKLDLSERQTHALWYALHQDLLALRRDESAFRAAGAKGVDGAVLDPHAFVLRFFTNDGNDRLLLVNLGRDLNLEPIPEPLLAPPAGHRWEAQWSSEDARYGGTGLPPLKNKDHLLVPGGSAIVLRPIEAPAKSPAA